MPIFEFECPKCGKVVEVIQKINEPAPECHGTMKKIMSLNTFKLKGRGWYATDYGKKESKSKDN